MASAHLFKLFSVSAIDSVGAPSFRVFLRKVGGRNLNFYKSRVARVGGSIGEYRSLLPTLAKERKDGAPRIVVIPARNQRVAHPPPNDRV
jgi:hypothetical protein